MTDYWNATRHPEPEYNRRKQKIQDDGIPTILQWQETGDPHNPFYSLRVTFPEDFEHLTLDEAQRVKEQSPESYHISIGQKSWFYSSNKWKHQIHKLKNKYLQPVFHRFEHVWVSNGGTYMLDEPSEVVREIKGAVVRGTGKDAPHISLD
jgi:hypothetical protein